MPADKKIGMYQVDATNLVPYLFPGAKQGNTVINTPFRGNATVYMLSTGGDLSIKLNKQDMNMYDGADTLIATLSLDGLKVNETRIGDDGFTDKSKSQTAVQTGQINIPNAKPGVYKLEFVQESAGSDLYVSSIEVNQSKVVFEGSMLTWGAIPTTIYTSDPKITVSTSWADKFQTLKANDKADLEIKEINKKIIFDLAKLVSGKPANELYKIFAPKGNINFSTDGYFSFSPETYFDPELIKATTLSTSDTAESIEKNFDFILTTVASIKEVGSWLVTDTLLSPASFNLNGKQIYFSLEIPTLDKQGGSLETSGLAVTLVSK
jgi:hypothetical protein